MSCRPSALAVIVLCDGGMTNQQAMSGDWGWVGKIKAGLAAAVVVLVVAEWLIVSHTVSWAMSALLPH
ncbi:hypothetical protein ACQ86B_28465 (plasmid) [Mycolicibacterium aichiense]|uniref:hypothetical protein n=1 Tax=Mycolicibacterium aichiense TaxID=1799 RepID=UPI003D6730A4